MDNLEVNGVNQCTSQILKIHSINLSHQLILFLIFGELPQPQHTELDVFPEFKLTNFLNEGIHEVIILIDEDCNFLIHHEFFLLEGFLEMFEGKHLVDEALRVFVGGVFDAEYRWFEAFLVDADVGFIGGL